MKLLEATYIFNKVLQKKETVGWEMIVLLYQCNFPMSPPVRRIGWSVGAVGRVGQSGRSVCNILLSGKLHTILYSMLYCNYKKKPY